MRRVLEKLLINPKMVVDKDLTVTLSQANEQGLRVIVNKNQEEVLTYLLWADRKTGVRIEGCSPNNDDVSLYFALSVRSLLPMIPSEYVIGLYPFSWHEKLEDLGFQLLHRRIRVKCDLTHIRRQRINTSEYCFHPVPPSAQDLAKILIQSDETCPNFETALVFIQDILDGDFGAVIYDASLQIVVGNIPVGFCIFTETSEGALFAAVCVKKEYQRKGVAHLLAQECLVRLVDKGHSVAYGSYDENNIGARRFSLSMGFKEMYPFLACSIFHNSQSQFEHM